MKLKPKVKEKWLTALRSGEYKQGRLHLKDIINGTSYHCCAGVLAEISGVPNKINSTPKKTNYIFDPKKANYIFDFNGVECFRTLPSNFINSISEPFDNNDPNPYIDQQKAFGNLYRMNDTNESFDEIANWIEENL